MTKIILDTDIGYDPDDLYALLFLRSVAKDDLALIVTADEVGGKRARFLQNVLALAHYDVPVAEGVSLGRSDLIMDDPMYGDERTLERDFVEAMRRVVDRHEKVRYVGIGGFTNLARYIERYPEDKERFEVTMMGGAIDYSRREGWVEHNVRIDIPSARAVLSSGWDLTLVMAQTTHDPVYEIGQEHPIHLALRASEDPLHHLLARHADAWYLAKGFGTAMHDPLTVATALGMDFVTLSQGNVAMDGYGRIERSDAGKRIAWSDPESRAADFMAFMRRRIIGD